jgi:hypothetical protein
MWKVPGFYLDITMVYITDKLLERFDHFGSHLACAASRRNQRVMDRQDGGSGIIYGLHGGQNQLAIGPHQAHPRVAAELMRDWLVPLHDCVDDLHCPSSASSEMISQCSDGCRPILGVEGDVEAEFDFIPLESGDVVGVASELDAGLAVACARPIARALATAGEECRASGGQVVYRGRGHHRS